MLGNQDRSRSLADQSGRNQRSCRRVDVNLAFTQRSGIGFALASRLDN